MWATATSQIAARLAGSTVIGHSNIVSTINGDVRPNSTKSSDKNSTGNDVVNKMREMRIRSPYALFVKDKFSAFKTQNPNLKFSELSRTIGQTWRSLDEKNKKIYLDKFDVQKAKYEQEKKSLPAEDLRAVDADEKASRIAAKIRKTVQEMPLKRPRSAYAIFLSTLDRGEAEMKVFMEGAFRRWSQLATEEKQKFEKIHEEERRKYNEQLLTWSTANSAAPVKVKSSSTKKKKSKTTEEQSSSSDEEKPKKQGKKSKENL